jgi:hypothetical protein
MTFPNGTPNDVMDRAMDDIRKAGGVITHKYKLLKYVTSLNSQHIALANYTMCHTVVWSTDSFN